MKIKDKWHIILLVVIFCFGLFFRIYRLDYLGLWLDEGFTWREIQKTIEQIINVFTVRGSEPPLYFLIMHCWIKLFGDSEFSLRLPSAIFGSISILLMYKVATLMFDTRVGLTSVLILSLSTFHIGYAQEARSYTLVSLLTLLSVYFFISLIRNTTRTNFVGYIVSTVLLLYNHYYCCFVLIAQNIHMGLLYILQKETPLKIERWIFSQVGIIILFTPWINNVAKILVKVEQEGLWIPKPSIYSLRETFLTYSGFGNFSEILFIIFTIFLFFSIISHLEKKDSRIYFLLVWFLIPIVLPYIISLVSTPIYHTRYTIPSSLAFYILVAQGMSTISSKHIKLAMVCLVIILSLVSLHDYYTYNKKEEWRELATFLNRNSTKEDLILVYPPWFLNSIFKYYFKKAEVASESYPACSNSNREVCRDRINLYLSNYKRIWLVLSHVSQRDLDVIANELQRYYTILDVKEFLGVLVISFR